MTLNLKLVFFLCLTLFLGCTKSNQESIVSFRDGGGLTDIEGNSYPSVIIENNNGWSQEWMLVNLKTGTYKDGTPISQAISDVTWRNNVTGAWCYYENDQQYENKYGKLYNWYALIGDTIEVPRYYWVNSSDPNVDSVRILINSYSTGDGAILSTIYEDSLTCKICPDGWRVPYEEDWIDLIMVLGYANVAGGKMKDTSSIWNEPNYGATNKSGFSGLPGGLRKEDGSFLYEGEMGRWWCFEDVYEDYVHTRPLMYDTETTLNHYVFEKAGGLSVRLIKIK